jgi:hypothetical protein
MGFLSYAKAAILRSTAAACKTFDVGKLCDAWLLAQCSPMP